MLNSGLILDWKSTFVTPRARGSGAQTRTLTDCCGSTFLKGQTSAGTLRESLTQLPSPSTAGLERLSVGKRPPKRSTRFYASNQLLAPHRSPASDAFASDCPALKND